MLSEFIKIAKNCDGIIFDLDGTILDSLYVWEGLAENYLLKCGITPPKNLSQTIFSMTMPQALAYLKEKYSLPYTVEEAAADIKATIGAAYKNEIKLKGDSFEILKWCKENKKRICAATAGERVLAEDALEHNGVLDFFEKIFTCTEENTSKNTADIYLTAARFMQLPPQKVLVVEDSAQALQVAKSAGFNTLEAL